VATLLVTPWGADLDRRWRDAAFAGHVTASRWCLCFNGQALRLVDAANGYARSYVEFDLDALKDDDVSFDVLWSVMRADSFVPDAGGAAPIERLVTASIDCGEAISVALRHGVLESVGLLLTALSPRPRAWHPLPGAPALAVTFEQALTIVYRVLFLLFAEAHHLVPDWHPVYREQYTIERLKHLAMTGASPRGLWEALQAISRLAHAGCEAGDLRVTPFNGRLFSPVVTPLAERRTVADEVARDALVALTTTRPRTGGRELIAYGDLGVEELGAVYETVLDYTPEIRRERDDSAWRVELQRGGRLRKDSSTFYTPRTLTDALVRRTLAPLVRDRDADAILSLRVLDPSMGSGAFLVAACRFLAHAYEEAAIAEGRCLPGDMCDQERARIRRTIAQRCLCGVDINPRAVQLARLSLWLTTLAADCPLTFLDHHLRCGDSLIGASPNDVRRQPPGGSSRRVRELPLLDADALQHLLSDLVAVRDRIAREPGDTLEAVRAKERALARLAAPDHDLATWTAVCDLWCAAWFWEDGALDTRTYGDLATKLQTRTSMLPSPVADQRLARAREIAERLRCFHWTLEFPEMFFDAGGASLGNLAGFDAIVGNPPWDMIRADPPSTDRRHVKQLTRFLRESGVFDATSDGHANRYQLFIERALQLAKSGGRIGLVVPAGLAIDRGSAALRRRLLLNCDTDEMLGFDNRDGMFPIHRSTRFLVLTTTKGGETRGLRCRFGLRSADALEQPRKSAPEIVLTPQLLRRISGNELAIPELRSPIDLAIVERIASRFPTLAGNDGWRAKFSRELNATDDKGLFVRDPAAWPVIEGKDLAPFSVTIRGDGFRIPAAEAERAIGRRPPRRLAFRDVASATNKLTLIAAILPERSVSVHTVFCLKTTLALRVQYFLSATLNSFVANYLIRMRVTTHVGAGPVERLRVPLCAVGSDDFEALVALAEQLETSEGRDVAAYVQLQARVAALYEMNEPEWAHIVSTFPLIEAEVREAALAAFSDSVPRRNRR
jgi:methylase of polypeptide subunit release factors